MGDAAHPMLPFLAQGAAQAIEDAGVLGRFWHAARRSKLVFLRIRRSGCHGRFAFKENHASKLRSIISAVRRFSAGCRIARARPEKMLARYDWLYDVHHAKSHQF